MFRFQNTGCQRFGCIGRENGNFFLRDDVSPVVLLIDQVNGTPGNRFAGINHSAVNMKAVISFTAELWKQCRVNVDDFS